MTKEEVAQQRAARSYVWIFLFSCWVFWFVFTGITKKQESERMLAEYCASSPVPCIK